MTARVAVTGAAGFAGAALVRSLLAREVEVLALVRPGGARERLREHAGHPALRVEPLDTGKLTTAGGRQAMLSVLTSFAPDAVVHAAWTGVRGAAREDPAQHHNVAATVALLEVAAAGGARRFVGLGSQAEYGPSRGALRETDVPSPRSVYGAAKLAAGHLVLAIAPRLGVSAAWVRVFSLYGGGEAAGALLPDLLQALRTGHELPLTSGEQLWDYLHVDDAAEALVRLVGAPDATGFFNLGSGQVVRVRDVVERLAALVAPSARLAFGALPDGDVRHLEADVQRLRSIGWEPRVSLEAGLAALARHTNP